MSNIIAHDINEAISHEVVKADFSLLNKFSDIKIAKYTRAVTDIIIYKSRVIDGIQFLYEGGQKSKIHGCLGNSRDEFNFRKGEYITFISWGTGDYNGEQVLSKICVKTNLGYSSELSLGVATAKEYSYQCDDLHAIVGLEGYASGRLNAITHVIIKEVDAYYADEKYYYDDYFSILYAKKLTKIRGFSGLVIDKLQFVYDNDDKMTVMHGSQMTVMHGDKMTVVRDGGGGKSFEFVLNSGEYIKKMEWQTAIVDYDGYGKSPVLTQIEICTNKARRFKTGYFGQSFEELGNHFKDHIHMKHRYTYEANHDEEIFCLAGVYLKFMGRITRIYKRKISSHHMLLGQINSDGKDILFVRNTMNKNGIDDAVKGLVDIMIDYHNISYQSKSMLGFDNNQKKRFAYFPPRGSENVTISSEDFQKALLSGQYKYISIYSHGSEGSCGNIGAPLVDVTWVRNNEKEIGKKLSNTIINFNCCECAYRGTVSQYDDAENQYEGLIREFIKAGLKAAFGYSISYLSISKYSNMRSQQVKDAYLKIYNLIDAICIKNLDSKIPEKLGEDVKKQMRDAIQEYEKQLPNFTMLCKNKNIPNMEPNQLAKYLGQEIIKKENEKYGNYFTKNGSLKKSEGVQRLRSKVYELVKATINEDKNKVYYPAYVDFLVNYEHLCGPGSKQADDTLKRDNLGEFCNDFCNRYSSGSETEL